MDGGGVSDPRFFRLVNFDKYQNFRGKRAHWMKLSLDFFDDPVIVGLPDSQRLAFIGVLILCAKRANRVPFDATYIKKRCSLRTTPDLNLFMGHGLIEFTQAVCGAEVVPRGEERREEERREEPPQPPAGEVEAEPPAGEVPPPRPAFGVLLDEARCPGCDNRGTVRMAGGGRGFFCGTKLGGCGQTFDIAEPMVLEQLTPRAKEAILKRLGPVAKPTALPPPEPRDTAGDELHAKRHELAEEFLAWYRRNPLAGIYEGRAGMHGVAFGAWPKAASLPAPVADVVRKEALAILARVAQPEAPAADPSKPHQFEPDTRMRAKTGAALCWCSNRSDHPLHGAA